MPRYFDNPVWDANRSAVPFANWSGSSATWDAASSPESFMRWGERTPGNIPGTSGIEPSAWEKFTGSKRVGPGWGNFGLNALQGISNFALGTRQLGLAKDQLATGKQQFSDQFGLQKRELNRDIRETGERRYARNPEANLTPEEYYALNKL